MKTLVVLLSLTLGAQDSVATAPGFQYGPPSSPLSWQDSTNTKTLDVSRFSPQRNVFGSAHHPATVQVVTLNDDRPYGEAGSQTVWLARYENVPLLGPDGETEESIAMSVAFNGAGDPICAFTDPAPHWLKPALPQTVETRVAQERWTTSSASYGDLSATLTDVLGAVWAIYGLNPNRTAQVILRPRFVQNTFPATMVDGHLVPATPPENVWIVEVLGTAVLKDHGIIFTTLIAELRDRDLSEIIGMRWY